MCFPADFVNNLQNNFLKHDLSLTVCDDHFIVEDSGRVSEEKVAKIVRDCKWCPLISQNRVCGNLAFTVMPYRLPAFFKSAIDNLSVCFKKGNQRLIQLAAGNPEGYALHFSRVKRGILSLAERTHGEALVLGLGNGDDIPLSELAERFDSVTALDMDLAAMQRAVQKLPLGLQNKIILIQKDLTGILDSLSHKIENLSAALTDLECLDQVGQYLEEVIEQPRVPLLASKKYSLVISSMITSQLFSYVHHFTMELLKVRSKTIENQGESSLLFSEGFAHFSSFMCEAHLRDLHSLTLPAGKVFYADTYFCSLINYDTVQDVLPGSFVHTAKMREKINTLPNELINSKIQALFTAVQPTEMWDWKTRPAKFEVRLYHVLTKDNKFKQALAPLCVAEENVMHVAASFLRPLVL